MLRQGAKASEHLSDFFAVGSVEMVCGVNRCISLRSCFGMAFRCFVRSWRRLEGLGDNYRNYRQIVEGAGDLAVADKRIGLA